MNISFNFKNFDPSAHLKEYARTRFTKLSKFVNGDQEAELQVNLAVEKIRQMAEVVLNADNVHISAYEESEDMYATIDMVLDKLTTQLRRMRDRQKSRAKKAVKPARMDVISFGTEDEPSDASIVQTDTFEVKPMSVEEGALQLDSRNSDFLVFRNADTDRINVIYRRKNNDFGLIDPGY